MPDTTRCLRTLCFRCGLVLILLPIPLFAQSGYQPSPENLKSRELFEQARFEMFIHWGIYSLLGDGEWVMQNHGLTAC